MLFEEEERIIAGMELYTKNKLLWVKMQHTSISLVQLQTDDPAVAAALHGMKLFTNCNNTGKGSPVPQDMVVKLGSFWNAAGITRSVRHLGLQLERDMLFTEVLLKVRGYVPHKCHSTGFPAPLPAVAVPKPEDTSVLPALRAASPQRKVNSAAAGVPIIPQQAAVSVVHSLQQPSAPHASVLQGASSCSSAFATTSTSTSTPKTWASALRGKEQQLGPASDPLTVSSMPLHRQIHLHTLTSTPATNVSSLGPAVSVAACVQPPSTVHAAQTTAGAQISSAAHASQHAATFLHPTFTPTSGVIQPPATVVSQITPFLGTVAAAVAVEPFPTSPSHMSVLPTLKSIPQAARPVNQGAGSAPLSHEKEVVATAPLIFGLEEIAEQHPSISLPSIEEPCLSSRAAMLTISGAIHSDLQTLPLMVASHDETAVSIAPGQLLPAVADLFRISISQTPNSSTSSSIGGSADDGGGGGGLGGGGGGGSGSSRKPNNVGGGGDGGRGVESGSGGSGRQGVGTGSIGGSGSGKAGNQGSGTVGSWLSGFDRSEAGPGGASRKRASGSSSGGGRQESAGLAKMPISLRSVPAFAGLNSGSIWEALNEHPPSNPLTLDMAQNYNQHQHYNQQQIVATNTHQHQLLNSQQYQHPPPHPMSFLQLPTQQLQQLRLQLELQAQQKQAASRMVQQQHQPQPQHQPHQQHQWPQQQSNVGSRQEWDTDMWFQANTDTPHPALLHVDPQQQQNQQGGMPPHQQQSQLSQHRQNLYSLGVVQSTPPYYPHPSASQSPGNLYLGSNPYETAQNAPELEYHGRGYQPTLIGFQNYAGISSSSHDQYWQQQQPGQQLGHQQQQQVGMSGQVWVPSHFPTPNTIPRPPPPPPPQVRSPNQHAPTHLSRTAAAVAIGRRGLRNVKDSSHPQTASQTLPSPTLSGTAALLPSYSGASYGPKSKVHPPVSNVTLQHNTAAVAILDPLMSHRAPSSPGTAECQSRGL